MYIYIYIQLSIYSPNSACTKGSWRLKRDEWVYLIAGGKFRRRFAAKHVYLAFRSSKKYRNTYCAGESPALFPRQNEYLALRRSKKYGKTYSAGEFPALFRRKSCYFWYFRFPTAVGPPGLSESTKYTPD